MSRSTAVRLASPTLWVIAILSALLSVVLTFTSASAVIGYPGPVAGPGRPAGPSLGSISVGKGTSGWAGGFNRGSRICYQLNGKPAGCVATEDVATGNLDGYAHFILSIGNSNPDSNNGPNCVGEPAPTGQITQDPMVGPVVPIKMGGNVLRIVGNATKNGVTRQVTIDLPFNVFRQCNGPTSTTTTTPGGTTTTTPGGTTTTTPGETTTTTPGETTTTTPGKTTTTFPGQTTTTPVVINGTTLAPYDPNADISNDPDKQKSVVQVAASVAAMVAIASAAAAAAAAAASAAAASSAAGAAGAAGGAAGINHFQPLDDGGDESETADEGAEGAEGTEPLDEGGEEAESGAEGTEPLDEGGEEAGSGAEGGEASGAEEFGEPVELPSEPGGAEPHGVGGGATSNQPLDDGGEEEDEEEGLPDDDGGFSGV